MFEFFKKIFKRFRKKKEKKEPDLSIEVILQKVISQNMLVITGETSEINISETTFPAFRELLDTIETAYLINTFRTSEQYPFMLFIPENFVKSYERIFCRVHSLPASKEVLLKLLQWMDGNLSRLFYINPDPNETGGYTVDYFFSLPKPYSKEEEEELLWKASECFIFRIEIGKHSVFAMVLKERYQWIEEQLHRNQAFSSIVRDQVIIEYTGKEETFFDREELIKINIEKPGEFVLSRFFLPDFLNVGGKNVYTQFKEVIVAKETNSYLEHKGLWFVFGVEYGGRVYPVYFFFKIPSHDEPGKYRNFFTKLLQGLLAKTVIFLKKYIHGVKTSGAFCPSPDILKFEETTILSCDISVSGHLFSCTLFSSQVYLNLLATLLLQPWEIDYLKKNLFTRMISLLSLNQSLFRKNISHFYKRENRKTDEGTREPEEAGYIKMFEFFNLIDDKDMSLIIRNYLLQAGWNAQKMRRLFYYLESGNIHKVYGFDEERFKKALPKIPAEDWQTGITGVQDYSELILLNYNTMKGLYRAVREKKVLLSYKAVFILEKEFYDNLKKHYLKKIELLLKEQNIGELISRLPDRVVQNTFALSPTRDLSMALLLMGQKLINLKKYFSKNYLKEITETGRMLKRDIKEKNLSYEEIYKSIIDLKKKLDRALKQIRTGGAGN